MPGSFNYSMGFSELEKRVAELTLPVISSNRRKEIFCSMMGMLDLTTLEGTDNDSTIRDLCRKALDLSAIRGFPAIAAICIYPVFIGLAKKLLLHSGIRVASVTGSFPSGQAPLHIKLAEVKYVLEQGADEIDIVINRGKVIAGEYNEVYDEIAATRDLCGNTRMKVILETGDLGTVLNIRKASEIALLAGADFLKTSTGKIAVGATGPAFLVMLDTIREYLEKTGRSVGIKASGGIRLPEQGLVYFRLTEAVMGDQWLTKDYFRIGASSLADQLVKETGKI
jgi:deoxyribose-phosphate aldolase